MTDERGVTIHFNDGSKMSLDWPKQTDNEAAAALRLEDVLKTRYMIFEVGGKLLLVPFENVKYLELHPAPKNVQGHTYIRNASIAS